MRTKLTYNPLLKSGFQKVTTELPIKVKAWAVSTAYEANETVTYQGCILRALSAHTSNGSAIDTDIDGNKWESIGGTSVVIANDSTPAVVGRAVRVVNNEAVLASNTALNLTATGMMVAGGTTLALIQFGGLVTLTTGQWDAVAGTTGGLTSGTLYYLNSGANGGMNPYPPSDASGFYLEQLIMQGVSSTVARLRIGTAKRSDFIYTRNVNLSTNTNASNTEYFYDFVGTATLTMYAIGSYLNDIRGVKISNNGTGTLTVACNGAETINGSATFVLPAGSYGSITLIPRSATDWAVV